MKSDKTKKMSSTSTKDFHSKITLAGSLIAIGIVFGDIGTSPLYTLNAVFHHQTITETIALGILSAVFWTLVFQTTIKYVIITLQADNNGEGGIFSLYALIRRYWGKWLLVPAMAGGAFLMADGIITPPISVASAIEGLQKEIPDINTIPIIITILIGLFLFQQFGSDKIGKIFGPVMVLWFSAIGLLGIYALQGNWDVLRALNPYYAYIMLVDQPENFWLLGGVFLCTTGAEALYSDMGHCGRNNIRISWIFIKIMLVLCYAGQTAWLLDHTGETIGGISPFFHIVPNSIYWVILILATLATVIASQALISGCFTLINEAIRLNIWPRHLVIFPGKIKGQLYIPVINWFLMFGCIAMVFYFKKSTAMEAAFGLSVTLTMLTSTVLLFFYMKVKRINQMAIFLITTIFLLIEGTFLMANLQKIKEGGLITLIIGFILFTTMYIWWKASEIKKQFINLVPVEKYKPVLKKLSLDEGIPKYATNIIYLTTSSNNKYVEQRIFNSILHSGVPKRADLYWFVHVNVTDEPYTLNYIVDTIVEDDIYFIQFYFGFRIEPRVDYYFRQIVNDMVANKEVTVQTRKEYEYQQSAMGDFRFVTMESFLSLDNEMPFWKNFIMKSYYNLKLVTVKESTNFGLEKNNLVSENYPLIVQPIQNNEIVRINK